MSDEPNGPKIVDMPARNELQGAVDATRRNLPMVLEYVAIQAKHRRAAYLALLAEGFTEQQALELCWRA